MSMVRPTTQGRVFNGRCAAARKWLDMMIFQALAASAAGSVSGHEGALAVVTLRDRAADRSPDVSRIALDRGDCTVARHWRGRKSCFCGFGLPRGKFFYGPLRVARRLGLRVSSFEFAELLPLESVAEFA